MKELLIINIKSNFLKMYLNYLKTEHLNIYMVVEYYYVSINVFVGISNVINLYIKLNINLAVKKRFST